MEKLNMIDLFCGAGGMSTGFEASDFDCLLGIDFDKSAIETFNRNHNKTIGINDDIRKISTKKIRKLLKGKKIHVVCGGPPCQGFSTVGMNDSSDKRNHLFLEFVRVVRALTPDFFVVENVTGLLSTKNEDTLKSIISSFKRLGYNVDLNVLSAHHHGVPEARRRVIIIGNRLRLKNQYPKIKYSDTGKNLMNLPKARTVGWAFDNLIKHRGKSHNHDLNSAKIKNKIEEKRLSYVPPGKGVRYREDEEKYLPKKLKYEIDWDKISEHRFRQTKLQRLSFEEYSPTINTSKTTYYHPTENRYLTVREAASIQSFPPNFIFTGSTTEQWRQVGNAVPPILAKEIADTIVDMYKSSNFLKSQKSDINKNVVNVRSLAFNYKPSNEYRN